MGQTTLTNDSDPLRPHFQPLLALNVAAWHGLGVLAQARLTVEWGQPQTIEEVMLGWYPAQRLRYPMEAPAGGLDVYVRQGRIIMVETLKQPPAAILETLGEPTAVLPHEILMDDAYVHEFLYCERGLVLSVAEPFVRDRPLQIARCRGLEVVDSPDQFGPEFYMAVEDRTVWE